MKEGEAALEQSEGEESAGPSTLSFPARRLPASKRWRLLILLPFLCCLVTYGPCLALPLIIEVAQRSLGLPTWMGVSGGFAVMAVALLGLVWMLFDAVRHFRSATLDDRGVVLADSPITTPTRITWEEIAAFSITAHGVMLQLHGRRKFWTRWLGPLLFCEGEQVHEVVVRLEERGIFRMGG